jgi:hypothetical protein
MDALREYKPEIVEAHRHGLNVHRIAEIFRERGLDISKIHLMRAIRRFIEEEERASAAQQPTPAKAGVKTKPRTVSNKPREEEWRRNGGGWGEYLGGRRPHLASIGAKGNGVRLGVKPLGF